MVWEKLTNVFCKRNFPISIGEYIQIKSPIYDERSAKDSQKTRDKHANSL